MNSPLIIGGSAGSFKILKKIFTILPREFSFPIIICVHRLKTSTGNLSVILKNSTLASLQEVDSNIKMEAGNVYIAPPDHHLIINEQYVLSINQDPPVKFSRPSIDVTMCSFSKIFRQKLIGILLTGANNDGTIGLQSIKESGGVSIVQDPIDAEMPMMPESAIKTFKPDYILDTDKIIIFIEKLMKVE